MSGRAGREGSGEASGPRERDEGGRGHEAEEEPAAPGDERDGTFWEVLTDDLRPYRGRLGLFRADEAMLWSAIFLELLERRASTEPAAEAGDRG